MLPNPLVWNGGVPPCLTISAQSSLTVHGARWSQAVVLAEVVANSNSPTLANSSPALVNQSSYSFDPSLVCGPERGPPQTAI